MANFKLLLPTYRTRQRWVERALTSLSSRERPRRVLHLGAGEGDYDPLLARFVDDVVACDISRFDVAFAREKNATLPVRYAVADAQRLPFADESFDLVVSVDVIEHVLDSRAMVREMARVVRRGGRVLLTCPIEGFPLSYDPLNRALALVGKHAPLGAYAYGHDKLMDARQVDAWLGEERLHVDERTPLSGPLTGLLEAYWAGLVQSLVKANAQNHDGAAPRVALRPDEVEPPLLPLVDALVTLDERLLARSKRSIGMAWVLTAS